jgi:hypothetical protein
MSQKDWKMNTDGPKQKRKNGIKTGKDFWAVEN